MTAQQRLAADPAASVWVTASAGTGKTKVLTDRVLRLLLDGTDPGRILCLTFTRAAAAEMAIRVTRTLGEWTASDDEILEEALREWGLEELRLANPADLSAGERQRTALAAMLAGRPRVVLLDEPTRGMDYETKEQLVNNLRRRCEDGCAVVIASHDVELVGRCADRVLLLSEGEVAVEGPVREVLTESLTFSTQVSKLLGGQFLTPEDVLGEGASE